MPQDEIKISKKVLFQILHSHSRLAQAEYHRNPSYNNQHFSHIAEDAAAEELNRIRLLEELLSYMIKETS